MTDNTTAQTPVVKKEDVKPGTSTGNSNNRTKKSPPKSSSSISGNAANSGVPRPLSRGSNKKPSTPSGVQAEPDVVRKKEKGSDKGGETKKSEQRGGARNQGPNQGRGGSSHRKGQASQTSTNRQVTGNATKDGKQPSAPVPVPTSEGSDALTSLQRVITDLKSISPPSQTSAMMGVTSTLPANAPVFQPGASAFPSAGAAAAASARHRRAASLGSYGVGIPPNPYSMPQYTSRLGSMNEDNEDVRSPQQQQHFEGGEMPEVIYGQQPFPRGQQQQFTAPRFTALAGQQQVQEQGEVLGPSGRPMLNPTFTFGARRRAASNAPLGPPISEEGDAGFQFPQQNQQTEFPSDLPQQAGHEEEVRRAEPDLVRQQVNFLFYL